MKITAIETFAVRIPVKPEYLMITALGRHDISEYVILRVLTDEGAEGAGEATVSERWSGETIWGCRALIEHVLGPALVGCDPFDIDFLNQRMDAACRYNWFAKSALEMACWDIRGRVEGRPVYELLGGACRDRSLRCRFSMGAYDVERARHRAAELVAQGFTTIKVKVGGRPHDDVARVRAVREVIGPEIELVLDANCGWDADTAIDCLHQLESCDVALMEQPTPDGDYGAMARVRAQVKPKIMADDICFDMVHAQELARNDCCDVISLYPGKNGGILKSKRIAEFAARHGVACSIGSNLEYDIATAAMCHMVIATENMKVEQYPGDMLGPAYHASSIVKKSIQIEGPVVTISNRPGLGIDVDWDVVRENRA